MTDVNQSNVESSNAADAVEQVSDVNQVEVDYEAKIAELTNELEQTRKNLENSRKSEKYAKNKVAQTADEIRAELTNQYQSQIDELNTRLSSYQEREINQTIKSALDNEKAIDSEALIKLVDKNDVDNSVKSLKEKHPNLFKQPTVPVVDKSQEGHSTSGLEDELRRARENGATEFSAIYKKYGLRTI